jgi:hypothetical protein
MIIHPTGRPVTPYYKYKSEVYREQDYGYFFKLIHDLDIKYPDHDIWTAAPGDSFYPYTATYFGHKGIIDSEKTQRNLN